MNLESFELHITETEAFKFNQHLTMDIFINNISNAQRNRINNFISNNPQSTHLFLSFHSDTDPLIYNVSESKSVLMVEIGNYTEGYLVSVEDIYRYNDKLEFFNHLVFDNPLKIKTGKTKRVKI